MNFILYMLHIKFYILHFTVDIWQLTFDTDTSAQSCSNITDGFCGYSVIWKIDTYSLTQCGLRDASASKNCKSLESFWTVWRVSRQSGKFLNNLEGFQPIWKISGQPGKFFGQSGRFLTSLESFRTVRKVFGQSGKILDKLESF